MCIVNQACYTKNKAPTYFLTLIIIPTHKIQVTKLNWYLYIHIQTQWIVKCSCIMQTLEPWQSHFDEESAYFLNHPDQSAPSIHPHYQPRHRHPFTSWHHHSHSQPPSRNNSHKCIPLSTHSPHQTALYVHAITKPDTPNHVPHETQHTHSSRQLQQPDPNWASKIQSFY